jgi:Protein of unknown function (DUF3768)
MTTQTEAIRALNDELRQNLTIGTAFITAGIAALGAEAVARIVKTIAVYDEFCHANDPHEEHDFGSFEVDGQTIFSRSIISIRRSPATRPILRIPQSPSASSQSCCQKSTDDGGSHTW